MCKYLPLFWQHFLIPLLVFVTMSSIALDVFPSDSSGETQSEHPKDEKKDEKTESKIEDKSDDVKYVEIDFTDNDAAVKVPAVALQKLRDFLKENVRSPVAKNLNEIRDKLPLTVYLTEKAKGTLYRGPLKVLFGPGGGELNFSKFVTSSPRGAFSFRVQPNLNGPIDKFYVLYVSSAIKRRVRGTVIGNGCRRMMDLSTFFKRVLDKKGVELFLEDRSYVSVWSGTYIFIAISGEKPHVGQLTLLDSRANDLLCSNVDSRS